MSDVERVSNHQLHFENGRPRNSDELLNYVLDAGIRGAIFALISITTSNLHNGRRETGDGLYVGSLSSRELLMTDAGGISMAKHLTPMVSFVDVIDMPGIREHIVYKYMYVQRRPFLAR